MTDTIAQDPALAAALLPTPDEVTKLARIDELQGLLAEAKDVWNREGQRVVATQVRPGGLTLDEDLRFQAADQLLQELQVELLGLRRDVDLSARIRVCTASVARHDDGLVARQARLMQTETKHSLRAEIARRVASVMG